ncbi:MAG TPA: Asp-tRNA(Asn)/Glu-tRNA(Gln) amidotransferase subunit GatC [bacterium]
MAQFSIADIEKIANLANLELSAEEKQMFAGQFTAILDYFAKIQEVKLPEGAAGAAGPTMPFREDVPEVSGVDPKSFSPYLEDHHFKVPKVIE